MSRLIVYAGPNGSGKSTLRDSEGDPVEVTIDPDRIARGLGSPASAGANVEAGKAAIRLFRAAIAAGQSLSMETTLTGTTVLARIKSARDAGYKVSLFYVALISVDDYIARVAARAANGGHHIPEDVIRRRVGASHDNLAAALALSDHGKVFDNSGPLPRHLLTVAHGRVLFQASYPPAWLESRMAAIQDVSRQV